MNLNKAFIIGNLTRDPESRSLPSGASVASFSVATNRVWRDQQGQKKEEVQFHNVVVFGKQADSVVQYLKKGNSVLVEGRIQTRNWNAQDGSKKSRTEIVAERVQFGPRKQGGDSVQGGGAASGGTPQKAEELETIEYPEEEINPDDIPF
ncbi:TPA: single-stranded DNA-binding protein [Patescibacteria group bacterium]|nr:MAG: Single-stranded DNA-binding protein [Parcubacteria group bacterium GW2011_GWF2_40_10]KKR47879.1 MAG: Single-stranded DNA-binding protein [Parcubacteria group bacterium GW2011_GWA2_40_143]KKR60327.1 MAG: Single-stranded DNA-binding protein [Parcubacteria group bacterium GW2011_GWC2_40_31]KKR75322.1 MAG: Single-stranded DNA-binding protein [Parcubacteria group bacterium GW2011_GWB2_40_8]KKR77537.1 MAG: Single-stranded DNA-binding protein [Parcubacteria group bacterium GW2011_GWE2_40_8]KK